MKTEVGNKSGDSWKHQLKHTTVLVFYLCLYMNSLHFRVSYKDLYFCTEK